MKRNIYTYFLLVFLVGSSLSLYSQLAWENLGPDNIGSVTRALVFDNNGNLLAGSQGGGLWQSSNDGQSWERVVEYDEAGGNPNITDILIDGNVIYVATGATEWQKPYARAILKIDPSSYDWRETAAGFKGNLDGLPGGGVFVFDGNWSGDNGTTKGPFGSATSTFNGPFVSVQRLAKNGNRIFVASRNGLFYSDTKMETLLQAKGTPFFQNSTIIDVAAAANNTIFAIAHNDNQSVGGDSLYISTDNGENFSPVVNLESPLIQSGNTPFGFDGGRIAVAPSDPNIVYVAGTTANLEINGVFQYDISTGKWTQKGPRGGPGFSPLSRNGRESFVMEVFPDNPNELIIAGRNWYTLLEGQGWTQTATHFVLPLPEFPGFFYPENYIPRNQYTITFDPTNSNTLFIGTSQQIIKSEDRGESFFFRTAGYESTVTYSVSSFKVDIVGEEPTSYDAVIGGTGVHGVLYNRNYRNENPVARQRFGQISGINYSRTASSVLYPGGLVTQGNDGGLIRSLNFGETFERFYGVAISPQVDSLIIPVTIDTLIDRPRFDPNSGGGDLLNSPVVAQTAWVLDEFIPESAIDNTDLTDEEAQAMGSYIYFCSKNYVWLVNGGLGDALQVKWNRITNELVDGEEEFLTAITVSGDEEHTVYVGSNKGNLWRIDRANDLENIDAKNSITKMNQTLISFIDLNMDGRSISDLAVDPLNPNRLVVVFSGFGGDKNKPFSYVWATDSARDNGPGFGPIRDIGASQHKQLIHSAEFVVENGKSVLLLGTQKGLFSVRDIELDPTNPFIHGDPPNEYHWPQYSFLTWTAEFDASFGQIPVYDIFVRKYSTTINENALTRTVEIEGRQTEVLRNGLVISEDQTIFVATHGRGFWFSSSLSSSREAGQPEPELVFDEAEIFLYPNPASDFANLELQLPERAGVHVDVFSVDGRKVAVKEASFGAGLHRISFDTQEFVPGMYIFRVNINQDNQQMTKSIKAVISK
ncbi:MAG: T9SS type A sorting domain-containing protein [Bacteroidota bacterium]